MKKNFNKTFSLTLFLLISALLGSCEEFEIDSIKLSNHTSQTTYYLAMTVEQSHLIDLSPAFPINNENKKRIMPPGEMAKLYEEDIWGYTPGDDLRFYFYEVVGDSAYFSGGLDVTHKQLVKHKFHIVLDDEELTTGYNLYMKILTRILYEKVENKGPIFGIVSYIKNGV